MVYYGLKFGNIQCLIFAWNFTVKSHTLTSLILAYSLQSSGYQQEFIFISSVDIIDVAKFYV